MCLCHPSAKCHKRRHRSLGDFQKLHYAKQPTYKYTCEWKLCYSVVDLINILGVLYRSWQGLSDETCSEYNWGNYSIRLQNDKQGNHIYKNIRVLIPCANAHIPFNWVNSLNSTVDGGGVCWENCVFAHHSLFIIESNSYFWQCWKTFDTLP